MKEPRWLSRAGVEIMHRRQLDEHGGLFGVRDENGFEAALARARNRFLYDDAVDVAALAACYAYAIARSHPFSDGNKRTAFASAAAFLYLNGFDLDVTEMDVLETILKLAAGEISESALAQWFRSAMRPL